jgi:hypothetical protein
VDVAAAIEYVWPATAVKTTRPLPLPGLFATGASAPKDVPA